MPYCTGGEGCRGGGAGNAGGGVGRGFERPGFHLIYFKVVCVTLCVWGGRPGGACARECRRIRVGVCCGCVVSLSLSLSLSRARARDSLIHERTHARAHTHR